MTPAVNADLLAARISDARVELFAGARHAYFHELEETATPAVLDFLNGTYRGRPGIGRHARADHDGSGASAGPAFACVLLQDNRGSIIDLRGSTRVAQRGNARRVAPYNSSGCRTAKTSD